MKHLTRSSDDRWIGGVCGGIAEYLDVDATLVRLALVIATLLGLGTLVIGYVVAWIIMPRRRPSTATWPGTPPPSV